MCAYVCVRVCVYGKGTYLSFASPVDNNVVFWVGFDIESFISESTLAEKYT